MNIDLVKQHAYLVKRGVRPMALIGHCPSDTMAMLKIATHIEALAEPEIIPFVIDRGDGIADYGYAAKAWVVDLYKWVVCASEETVPSAQRHRLVGLLLGYSVESIREHGEHASGRHFQAPSEWAVSDEPASNSRHPYSLNTAEIYPPH